MSGRRTFHRNAGSPEFNLALVGALGVGKSALTVKYITRRFIMEYDPDLVVGRCDTNSLNEWNQSWAHLFPRPVQFWLPEGTYTKHEDWDGQDIVVHVMDTCDKDDSDPSRYLKWADAFLIVYSITTRPSFDVAKDYLDSISLYLKGQGRECPLALVGNKMDLERYRQVNKSEGASLATEYDCLFYETAAAEEYELVERVFQRVIQDAHHEKYGHILQSLFIADDRLPVYNQQTTMQQLSQNQQRRPKSPKGVPEKKDEKNQQKKTLNKFFKIFN